MTEHNPMTETQIEHLRRRMGEVAALPTDDPLRLAVLAEVAAAGEWAEHEWVELQQFDERTRVALRKVDAPAGLADRLASIPAEAPVRVPWLARLRPMLAAAAALLIAAAVWTAWPSRAYTAEQIAGLAVAHYRMDCPLQVETADPRQIEAKFANTVGWRVGVPAMGDGVRLIGGRACRLAGHTIVCTRWVKDGVRYAVYQFCPTDFRMPDALAASHFDLPDASGALAVDIWTDDHGCSYARVREPIAPTTPI